MSDMTQHIEALVRKAADAEKSEDAMRFSQAACNAANTMACLDNVKRAQK